MTIEQKENINAFFGIENAENGAEMTLIVSDYIDSNVKVVAEKTGNDEYTFRFSNISYGNTVTHLCKSSIRGNIRTLTLGYLKLMNDKFRRRMTLSSIGRVDDMIIYLESVVDELPVDESKVDMKTWKIPKGILAGFSL